MDVIVKKTKLFIISLACLALLVPIAALGAGAGETPKAFFPIPSHTFDPVVEGRTVLYTYTIQNKGDKTLEVQKVRTGWGCTTVSYSKTILPGAEGKIAIKVNTRGYGGKLLKKTIKVLTDDPKTPEHALTISGNVKKFVTIEPRIVRLFGKPGDALAATVNIAQEKAYPFKVKKVKTLNREPLEHSLEPWEDAGGHGYRIKVNLSKKEAGLFRDALILETDSDIQPEIRINVMAHVEDPAAKAAAASSGKIKEKQDFNQLIQSLKKQQKTNGPEPSETTPKPRNPEEIKKLFQELIKNQQKTE